ncbi:unnamed protein product [Thlaspi arvense]|uniref:Uncharacterized protein n=1 Tax=Thlaspi arvense TaxID=13288 RepID=A0AAU9RSK1_THLAR|nr:unnamed protein product [Thlaspi arvense]
MIRWSLIAGRLPGRTDNEIKNYWNTHLSKKLINQGIDPRTHKPLLTHPNPNPNPNPDLSTSSTAILSTDPNPNPFPNLNPNLSFSAGLESLESERALVANHVSNPSPDPRTLVVENKEGNSSDHYPQEYRVANNCNQTSWNHSDGTLMGLQSTHGNYGNQDNCIGYFNDDIFSTFLTSLINEEDVFKNQQPEHTNMMTVPSSSTQPVMPSMHMQVSNHGMAAWEASLQQASNMQPTFSYEWNGFNNQFA